MQTFIFLSVREYVDLLSATEQAKFRKQVDALSVGDSAGVHTKKLKGEIRELVIGDHRVTYFSIEQTIFFVRAFRKKTRKTPKQEIRYTERTYIWLKEKRTHL